MAAKKSKKAAAKKPAAKKPAAKKSPVKKAAVEKAPADKAAPGTPGTLTLSVDGVAVASGRLGRTVGGWLSHTEGLDIGLDRISPVSPDYRTEDSAFTGVISEVRVSVGQSH